ncbi:hypothetical protein [Streptomyces sp. NPDC056227]|uniref:hypothetical protein n=1 Tax=Streptomyces sp. NPDC056227 TaxID=3345753 RepID=UPI0035DB09AF
MRPAVMMPRPSTTRLGQRSYTGAHDFLVKEQFRKASEAKTVHRLGDPQWLGEAVAGVAVLSAWWAPSASRQVREITEDLAA